VPTYPTVDESLDRLHRAVWSVGLTGGATLWLVSGSNGKNASGATGKSLAERLHPGPRVGYGGLSFPLPPRTHLAGAIRSPDRSGRPIPHLPPSAGLRAS
jgi:hypothetical protein